MTNNWTLFLIITLLHSMFLWVLLRSFVVTFRDEYITREKSVCLF